MAYHSNGRNNLSSIERIWTGIDELEKQVEFIREQTNMLKEQQEKVLQELESYRQLRNMEDITDGEREEIGVTIDRLASRCLTVELSVRIVRSDEQEAALKVVKEVYMEELRQQMENNLLGSRQIADSYLNSCLPEAEGAIHPQFQAAVLQCCVDDQKRIRKKLEQVTQSIRLAQHSVQNASLSL